MSPLQGQTKAFNIVYRVHQDHGRRRQRRVEVRKQGPPAGSLPAQAAYREALDVDDQYNQIWHVRKVAIERAAELLFGRQVHEPIASIVRGRSQRPFDSSLPPGRLGADLVDSGGTIRGGG